MVAGPVTSHTRMTKVPIVGVYVSCGALIDKGSETKWYK
jgi:hypothetical protein